jgi:hypothetical protein
MPHLTFTLGRALSRVLLGTMSLLIFALVGWPLSAHAAPEVGIEYHGASGAYDFGGSNCNEETPKSDPVGTLFKGKWAGPTNVAEYIASENVVNWHYTENSHDNQALLVREKDGSYGCHLNEFSRASATENFFNSRSHIRLWFVPGSSGPNGSAERETVGTPHHEDWVWRISHSGCVGATHVGNHAIDQGGVHQETESGFDRAREELRRGFENDGFAALTENWGNTHEFEQCDGGLAGSNGSGTIIFIERRLHPVSKKTLVSLPVSGGGGASPLVAESPTATANGRLNTGESKAEVWFGWGPSPARGSGYAHKTSIQTFVGEQEVNVSANLGSLSPNSNYYVRMFARSPSGQIEEGAQRHFSTAKVIQDGDQDQPGPHTIANANGAVDSFFRTSSGTLGHAWTQGGAWTEQDIAGTQIAPDAVPHPVISANGTIDVFWRQPGGGIGHAWDDAEGWHAGIVPGALIGEPHARVSADGSINVFFEETSGALGRDHHAPGGSWTLDATMPGSPRGDVMPVVSGNTLEAFYKTPSGTLGRAWSQSGGSWTATSLAGTELGAGAVPFPVVGESGQVDVFWRTPTDGIGHAWEESGSWHVGTLAGTTVGEPSPVEAPNGVINLFFRTPANEMGRDSHSVGGSWTTETISANVGSEVLPVVQPDGEVDAFFLTEFGEVGHVWNVGEEWHAEGLGQLAASIPSAVVQTDGTPDVLYRTAAGGLGHLSNQQEGEWLVGVIAGSVAANPPAVAAEAASNLATTAARLHERIKPQGSTTTYHFEYGKTTSYGSSTATVSGGGGWTAFKASAEITGLTAATLYHYRVVATNETGTTYGPDETFQTVGPAWSSESVPKPASGKSTFLDGVSCQSVTACKAVGTFVSSVAGAGQPPLAETLSGTTWSAQEALSVGTENVLLDISCPTSSWCMAVGLSKVSGAKRPLAEVWNGTTWAVQTVPTPGTYQGQLTGVSCRSAEWCMATGGIFPYEERMFLAHWNGKEWTSQEAPSPAGGSKDRGSTSVSCPTTSFCEAVGSFTEASGGSPLAVRWNGVNWSAEEVPPAGGAGGERGLTSVSCFSAAFCEAVLGVNRAYPQLPQWFGIAWNGTAWTKQPFPEPTTTNAHLEEVDGLSCYAANQCLAVGNSRTGEGYSVEELPLAVAYQAGTWTLQQPPIPTGALGRYQISLMEVSCVSGPACVAVGTSHPESGEAVPIAEVYK